MIVDARSEAEFAGWRFWPSGAIEDAGRFGHIAAAAHIPSDLLRDEDGTLKSAGDLRALFEASHIGSDDRVLTYCTIGNRASQVWFALKYALGHHDVSVSYGSWVDGASSPAAQSRPHDHGIKRRDTHLAARLGLTPHASRLWPEPARRSTRSSAFSSVQGTRSRHLPDPIRRRAKLRSRSEPAVRPHLRCPARAFGDRFDASSPRQTRSALKTARRVRGASKGEACAAAESGRPGSAGTGVAPRLLWA
jgi:rhodanese-related sulfurtransferase